MNSPKIFSEIDMNFVSYDLGTFNQRIIYIQVVKLNITETIISIKEIGEVVF